MTAAHDDETARVRRVDARRNLATIVEAAARMLAENPRVSMQEIALAAGLHRATVHRHFPSREDLVRAVIERAYDESDRAVEVILQDESASPRMQLERVIDAFLEVGDRWRVHRFVGVTPEVQSRRRALSSPLRQVVGRAQAAGDLRDDLSAEDLSTAIGGLITATLGRMGDGSLDAVGARDLVLRMVAPAA